MPRELAERQPNPLRFHFACISVGLLLSILVSTLEPWLPHERAVCQAGVVENELEASESDAEENHLDGAQSPLLHTVATATRLGSSGSMQRVQGGTDLANQASAEQHRQRPPPVCS